jgi:hypothetical protein
MKGVRVLLPGKCGNVAYPIPLLAGKEFRRVARWAYGAIAKVPSIRVATYAVMESIMTVMERRISDARVFLVPSNVETAPITIAMVT